MIENSHATPSEPLSRARLSLLVMVRTILNVPFRIVYPFLPSIARGLGVSLAAANGLITLRWLVRMAAPLLGPLLDRYERRRVMEAAFVCFTLAGLLLAGVGTFAATAVAFILYGIAKALHDPATHAYVGDAVPYHERGRAMGIIELAWSLAWLLGVPASGILIDRFDWRAPWAILIALGLLGMGLTRVGLPPVLDRPASDTGKPFLASTVTVWRGLLRRRSVVFLLLTSVLITLAVEIPFIVYGAWIEESFGLSLTALGLASAVVGLAEAAAEGSVAMITDRLGKRRSVLAGLLGLAASLIALPWLSGLGLAPALVGVVLALFTFEFGVVSLLPLVTELAPDARAALVSINGTAFGFGRVLAALIGGWLWRWQSASLQNPIALHARVGAVCAIVAAILLVRGVEDDGGERG